MRRTLIGLICLSALAWPAGAQQAATTRAAIDEFVVTVRDMAAWALVTPAAHIPVGGILDATGNVESVVGSSKESMITPDSVLDAFRKAIGAGGRRQRSHAIGIGYIVKRAARGSSAVIDGIVVEVEFRTGYRTNVLYPYTRTESGEPVFGAAIRSPGTLREIAGRRQVAEPDPVVATAPVPARDTLKKPTLEEFARRIVSAVPYPTFITKDASGQPQARTVQPLQPDSTWTVWFATNPRTRKVGEIVRDARVVLHYFDLTTLSYVSLIGRARVVRDRATKDAHWDARWDAFYPDRDTSVVLIAVKADRLEVVSSTLGISGDAATWRPPVVRLPR
jgi:general stress protein 26